MECLQVLTAKSDDSTLQSNFGLMALSREDTNFLAFPGHALGDIILHDVQNLRIVAQIQAHKSKLAQFTFNPSGTYLATASITGTVIRVFLIPSGELIHTFRRGLHHVYINSLSFCAMSQFLSAGSSSGTVHVFLMPSVLKILSNGTNNLNLQIDDSERRNNFTTIDTRNQQYSNNVLNNRSDNNSSETTSRPVSMDRRKSNEPYPSRASVSQKSAQKTWQWQDAIQLVQQVAVNVITVSTDYLSANGILPEPAREFVDSSRAVCVCRLPSTHARNDRGLPFVCEFKASLYRPDTNIDNVKVVIVTEYGNLYRFKLPPIKAIMDNLNSVPQESSIPTTNNRLVSNPSVPHSGWGINPPLSCNAWEDETNLLDDFS
jgi:hypothetical protein